MDTPGKILKTEREHQGKSLKDISVNLKLSMEYLTAIEEDDYTQLPAEVFTKAYLRLYAEELGLDGDYILGLFHGTGKDEINENKPASDQKSGRSSARLIKSAFSAVTASGVKVKHSLRTVPAAFGKLKDGMKTLPGIITKLKPSGSMNMGFIKRAIPFMPGRTFLLAGIAVISAVFGAMIIRGLYNPVTVSSLVPDKQIETGNTSIGEKAKGKAVDKTGIRSTRKKRRVKDKVVAGKLVLEIIADELTWTSVRIDDGQFRETLMRAGEAVTVRAKEKFHLKIGNAGGTRLVLNGRDMGKLGPHGKVVNITLP